ncbi:MAG: electron transport complex subunit RsxG [Nitrosomonadales bacterium]|nr:electron transport complex subunit RsxG [Nitrosomonadales bacterium]
MSSSLAKVSLKTALNLLAFTVVGTALLAFSFNQTHELIAQSEEREKLKLINEIVPPSLFDNAIVQDALTLPADPLLGTGVTSLAYRGRLQGQPSVVVLSPIAPDGYSGKIFLLVAIRENGSLAGVRVASHRETPGLGDYIELPKSPWIKGFDDKSHAVLPEAEWKVKKDGGQFDYMAGATITPRAVVKAVNKSLNYFEANRDKLFAQEPQP